MYNFDYYTNEQLFKVLMNVRGNYVSGVIYSPKRKTPHPLADAHIGRNKWDRKKADAFLPTYLAEKEQRAARKQAKKAK